jgi:4-hydroxy-tetrahydrodipicolinate reductase
MKISIIGATGRMGQLALSLIEESPDLELHSALGSSSDLRECLGADLVLDLTKPEVSREIAEFAIENDLKLLVGTSGWDREKLLALESRLAGSNATIVIVPNFSIGSVLATKFVAEASKYFDDVEIVETHHPKKLDAPSGTALYTSQAIFEAREGKPISSKESEEPRFNTVPIKSLRIEGAHAEQEVFLKEQNESLYVKHSVSSHETYAKGLLLAIRKTPARKGLTVGLLPLLEES